MYLCVSTYVLNGAKASCGSRNISSHLDNILVFYQINGQSKLDMANPYMIRFNDVACVGKEFGYTGTREHLSTCGNIQGHPFTGGATWKHQFTCGNTRPHMAADVYT